jgi:hypothetical protein
MRNFAAILFTVAVLLFVAVCVSFIPSNLWFIRTIDLIREPMAYIAAALLIIAILVGSRWRWATVAMFAVAIGVNVWRLGLGSRLRLQRGLY